MQGVVCEVLKKVYTIQKLVNDEGREMLARDRTPYAMPHTVNLISCMDFYCNIRVNSTKSISPSPSVSASRIIC